MDFEIVEYNKNRLRIIGSIDPSSTPNIEIILDDVFFISSPLSWQTDTSEQVISLLDSDAKQINEWFKVEQGYYIVQWMPEDYPEGSSCLFGVKALDFSILK